MSTGSAIFFTPEKRLMTGGRIIKSAVPIHHWITRFQLNLQQTGETGNMKKTMTLTRNPAPFRNRIPA
jgi:hypothetical protein